MGGRRRFPPGGGAARPRKAPGDPTRANDAPSGPKTGPNASPASARPTVGLIVLLLVFAALATAAKAARDYTLLVQSSYRYADTGRPMLTNADGYHFVRLAQNLLNAWQAKPDAPLPATPEPRPRNGNAQPPGAAADVRQAAPLPHGAQTAQPAVPALARALALAAFAARLAPESVALWMAPVLSLSLILPVWAWGRRLGGEAAGPAAAFAAAVSPYWMEVAALGTCQTPCLVPALLLCCASALYRLQDGGKKRPADLALFLACAALCAWWWRPGGYLCAAMMGCALVGPGRVAGRAAPLVRGGVLVAAAAMAVLYLGGLWRHLPSPFYDLAHYAVRHIGLALKTDPDQAAMAASIIELSPLSLNDLALLTGGSPVALAAGLAGLALGLVRRPRAVWPLLPLLAAGPLGLRSMRMTLFFFPLVAVGMGTLAAWAWERPLARLRPHAASNGGAACLAAFGLTALLCGAALARDFSAKPENIVDHDTDAMALAAARFMPGDAALWSWWDYGYYLAWRTGRVPFFDGGSQTAGDAFTAAFPLVCADADLAADWMRFFAARGQGEFDRLGARCGSKPRALALLTRLFSGREDPAPLMRELGGDDLADPEAYFFPQNAVCLVLPWDMWKRNGHWMAYGSSPLPPTGPPGNDVDVFCARGLNVDAATGRVTLPDQARAKGYDAVGAVVDLAAVTPGPDLVEALPDPLLLYHLPTGLAFIADRAMAKSLAFRLLAPTGFTHARFTRLAYAPGAGGAWLVKPRAPR